ncbi:MAG: AAA family ATPase, partial [Acidimicrobiales bacterium]
RSDLVVVTADGDRFADSGWRVRASKGVVTAAAVEDARRQADHAAVRADEAAARLGEARREAEELRVAAAAAARAADQHEARRAGAAAERATAEEEVGRLTAELEAMTRSRADATGRTGTDAAALEELERSMVDLEAAAVEAARQAEQASAAAAGFDVRRRELADLRHDLEVRAAGLTERRRVMLQRRSEVERRLLGHAEEREEAAARRRRLEADGIALDRLASVVERERRRLENGLAALRVDYRRQVDAVRAGGERLETLRQRRNATDGALVELRERVRALDLEAAAVSLRRAALGETVQRELGSDAAEALEAPAPDIPEGLTAIQYAARLADQLAALGPVNPLALEELSTLEERYHELDTQVADVRSARRDLQDVVRVLDDEIMQSFATAAADVNEHFSALVAMLFPGGTGRISLTDPDDLLNTGVEIEVRPAGRNVRRVSLLSGGERSLAALAFLFAVFRSRPSPFYLMDEVEAALDDVNLHRFLDLVREFRDEAQLIIVSHQKRTMETGDALYGVTMAPGGSSQVVSQKVAGPAEPAPT